MLVVHFYPVAFQPVLDPGALPAPFAVSEDLALEVPAPVYDRESS